MSSRIEVVHTDDWLVVVAKPGGVPSQPDPTGDASALSLAEETLGGTLFPVHRIDRPASGLLVFGRSREAAGRLSGMVRDGSVRRVYWAIVPGTLEPPAGELRHALRHDRRKNKSYVDSRGKPASLRYATRAVGDRYSLLQIELTTGRHHQIRVQLAAVGKPIRGDLKYGARRSQKGGGIGLHAVMLAFAHPADGSVRRFVAKPPADSLWSVLTVGLTPASSDEPPTRRGTDSP
jgi:23S rRNA pseudouridine1911/1915/1917 synthase